MSLIQQGTNTVTDTIKNAVAKNNGFIEELNANK